ncbi:MAG: hypothetical protein KIS67_19945 [Verrucomicrobiae bacterium]|nr:hypothetical protein [Verrucomicrobiae bacterium]
MVGDTLLGFDQAHQQPFFSVDFAARFLLSGFGHSVSGNDLLHAFTMGRYVAGSESGVHQKTQMPIETMSRRGTGGIRRTEASAIALVWCSRPQVEQGCPKAARFAFADEISRRAAFKFLHLFQEPRADFLGLHQLLAFVADL